MKLLRHLIKLAVRILSKIPGTTYGEIAEMSDGPSGRCVGRSVHGPTNLPLVLLFITILASAYPAQAQVSVFSGASFDGSTTPHTSASVGFMVPVSGDKLVSYTMVNIRGVAKGEVPTYVGASGLAYQIGCQGKFCLYSGAQAGGASSSTAVSGLLQGGLIISTRIKPKVNLLTLLQAQKAPAAGPIKATFGVGLSFLP